jgi:hypothetical protein
MSSLIFIRHCFLKQNKKAAPVARNASNWAPIIDNEDATSVELRVPSPVIRTLYCPGVLLSITVEHHSTSLEESNFGTDVSDEGAMARQSGVQDQKRVQMRSLQQLSLGLRRGVRRIQEDQTMIHAQLSTSPHVLLRYNGNVLFVPTLPLFSDFLRSQSEFLEERHAAHNASVR